MKVVVYAQPNMAWHKRYLEYFRAGFKAHGIKIEVERAPVPHPKCDVAVLFGPNYWKPIERSAVNYLMVNRKFIGDVNDDVAIGWNGLNGRGRYCVGIVDPSRFARHEVKLKPWRNATHGGIMILGQADLGRCGKYISLTDWYNNIQRTTGDDLYIREWPGKAPMERDIQGMKAAVSLNSTAAIETIILGLPTTVQDEGSPAFHVAPHNLGHGHRNWDRKPWLEHLACCQYHFTEILDGTFWKQLWPPRGPRLCDVEL